jgi:hypothetical protein
VEIYSARASNHGIFAVAIDGGGETLVDLYSSSRSDRTLVYTSPVLSAGNHTLRVRVTGNRNGSASGAAIVADLVKVIVSDSAVTPVPTVPPTGAPTAAPTTAPGLLGDVNGDGNVNIIDALRIAQFYVGNPPADFNQAVADVDCNGTINIVDALRVAQYYVGLINAFC